MIKSTIFYFIHMDATAAIKIEQYRLRVRFRKLLTCCSDNCRDWWFNHAHHMPFHSLSHAVSSFTNAQRIYGNKKWYIWIFIWFLLLFNFSMNSPLHIWVYMQLLSLVADFFYGIYLLHRLINHGLNFPQLFLLSCAHQLSRRFIEVDIAWTLLALFVSLLLLLLISSLGRCLFSYSFFTGISIANNFDVTKKITKKKRSKGRRAWKLDKINANINLNEDIK